MKRSAALTEEQERVVQRARDNMNVHDWRPALARWLGNYGPDPKRLFQGHYWYTITRSGRDWSVAIGFSDATVPFHTFLVDGRAPAPPVMEWRPPPPEPVPHRFNVPPPIDVPEFRETVLCPEPDGGLTLAALDLMIRRMQQEYAVPAHWLVQQPVLRITATDVHEREQQREAQSMFDRYALAPLIRSPLAVVAIDVGDEPKPAPPPTPSRRNQ